MDQFEVFMSDTSDLELLVSHRQKMWKAIYPEKTDEIDAIEDMTRAWIRESVESGKMIPLVVRTLDGLKVGSGCILLREDQPRPGSTVISNPYLLSVYTEESFRKKGIASMIVKESINWARKNGYDRMTLHASPDGRPIYEGFGFIATNEMRLWFK